MSDLEKLKALFTELGIGWQEFGEGYNSESEMKTKFEIAVRCRSGNMLIAGYADFYTDFYFTAQGKFTCMGVWE